MKILNVFLIDNLKLTKLNIIAYFTTTTAIFSLEIFSTTAFYCENSLVSSSLSYLEGFEEIFVRKVNAELERIRE